jgi:ubiquinone/menaquinone biosynthesis C-methylase UbiE
LGQERQTRKQWTAESLGQLTRGYQAACVLIAASELDLFTRLQGTAFTAAEAASGLASDPRGTRVLLDALAALGLLEKSGECYEVPPGLGELLGEGGPGSVLGMTQHQGTCLRRWARLGHTVKTGRLPDRALTESLRGQAADYRAFIEAMDNVNRGIAQKVIDSLMPLEFKRLLDIGGASGTWTIAFLKARPEARATIFDLPQVIPQARERIGTAGLSGRVELVPGDFYRDRFPGGADLAWVSAIIHQNSREQNRALFSKVFEALEPGGRILVRDFLMESSRTAPVAGALFAVNMLAGTEAGGTYTVEEIEEDFDRVGFTKPRVLRREDTMHSVMAAFRP